MRIILEYIIRQPECGFDVALNPKEIQRNAQMYRSISPSWLS